MTGLGIEQPPSGWKLVLISDLVIDARSGFACGERDDKGTIQLRMNNVTTTGRFDWSDYIRVPTTKELVARYQLESGDVLFNNTNSTELVGKSALFSGHKESVVYSNHFTRIRLDSSICNPFFFTCWLNQLWQTGVFAAICNQWVGQSAIKFDKLSGLTIPLPPLSEQQRIARILKTKLAAVERALLTSEARLEAVRALPVAYTRAVFIDRQDGNNWPFSAIGEIAEVAGGIQKTPNRKPSSHSRPYLTVRNVQRGYLDLSCVEHFEITPAEVNRYHLEDEDLLIVEGNGSCDHIGRNALFIDDGQQWVHQNHVIRVRVDKNRCHPSYISAYLNSEAGKKQMLEKAETTSGLYTLSTSKIRSIKVPLPILSEQKKLANLIFSKHSLADASKGLLDSQHAAIKALSAALHRQAFSGAL